ncbi:UNVERIFIED_CONTAM: hypothetical protein Cloal_2372 [Acetivibrio alkalicellulosi]
MKKIMILIFMLSFIVISGCQNLNNSSNISKQGTNSSDLEPSKQSSLSTYKTDIDINNNNTFKENLESDPFIKDNNNTELESDLDEISARSLAQRFCNDMADSWLNLKRIDMSTYLIDNLDTHLALKWIDFEVADRTQNTWKQLVSIDRVVISSKRFEKTLENKFLYEAFADIGYTRKEPSVNGMGIGLTLEFERIDGTWMITSADTIGASIYNEWKDSFYRTIEEMDEAFIKSCEERGIFTLPTY